MLSLVIVIVSIGVEVHSNRKC